MSSQMNKTTPGKNRMVEENFGKVKEWVMAATVEQDGLRAMVTPKKVEIEKLVVALLKVRGAEAGYLPTHRQYRRKLTPLHLLCIWQ